MQGCFAGARMVRTSTDLLYQHTQNGGARSSRASLGRKNDFLSFTLLNGKFCANYAITALEYGNGFDTFA